MKAKEVRNKIEEFVRENYGEDELENPSWNIDGLIKALCQEDEPQCIGTISVDSGTIMVSDPCYWVGKITPTWGEFCDEVGNKRVHNFNHYKNIVGKGTAVSCDDGLYNVYYDGHKIVIDLD